LRSHPQAELKDRSLLSDGPRRELYNPIFRVHLDRTTSIGVNWFTVGVIAVAGIAFWLDKKKSAPGRIEARPPAVKASTISAEVT
jgi:hypothetical protein